MYKYAFVSSFSDPVCTCVYNSSATARPNNTRISITYTNMYATKHFNVYVVHIYIPHAHIFAYDEMNDAKRRRKQKKKMSKINK